MRIHRDSLSHSSSVRVPCHPPPDSVCRLMCVLFRQFLTIVCNNRVDSTTVSWFISSPDSANHPIFTGFPGAAKSMRSFQDTFLHPGSHSCLPYLRCNAFLPRLLLCSALRTGRPDWKACHFNQMMEPFDMNRFRFFSAVNSSLSTLPRRPSRSVRRLLSAVGCCTQIFWKAEAGCCLLSGASITCVNAKASNNPCSRTGFASSDDPGEKGLNRLIHILPVNQVWNLRGSSIDRSPIILPSQYRPHRSFCPDRSFSRLSIRLHIHFRTDRSFSPGRCICQPGNGLHRLRR